MKPLTRPNKSCALAVTTGFLCVSACQPVPVTKTDLPVKPVVQPALKTLSIYPAHFQSWLTENPEQASAFEALRAYLTREGVADVLPLWQLIQTETPETAAQCGVEGFAMPPKEMWPTMVPTLRLVRQEIVPLLGPVKVLSSFRTPEANRCSSGAPQSPHRRYSALDLSVVAPMAQKELFAKLCKRWDQVPDVLGFGLGAYYTRSQPWLNKEGRFHIDTLGRRTWGFGYGAYTSHCRELGYISVKSPDQIKAEDEAKLKVEADVLAKEVADAKAKSEAIAIAKAKAKEDARVQVLEARKAAAAVKDVAVTPANAGAASVQNVIASKTLEPKDKAGESPSREKREHSAPKP